MKKYISIYIILVTLSACNDFLDLKPKNEQGIESIKDVRSLLGAYLKYVSDPNKEHFVGEYYMRPWNGTVYKYTSSYSNQMMPTNISDYSTGELTPYGLGYYNWQSLFTSDAWTTCYMGIGPMNLIIDKAKAYHDNEPKTANYIIGEAKFWRAYYFFNLIQQFSPYKQASEGVPLYFKGYIDPINVKLPKNSQGEVYKQILTDLQDVLDLLEITAPDRTFNIAYNPIIVNALMAKVYQFKAESGAGEVSDWELAKKHAESAINGRSLYTSAAKLKEMFNSSDSNRDYKGAECDLRISFREVDLLQYYHAFTTEYKVESSVFDLYAAGDIRKEAYYTKGIDWTTGTIKFLMDKFSQYNRWSNNYLPVMPFRLAELYLIKAEAQAKLNDLASAIETINTFRDARYSGGHKPVAGTQNQLIDSIMIERKREFAFEYGIWWFDMKRTQSKISRKWETKVDGKLTTQTYTLKGDDFRYSFPIPESELKTNPYIKQDPGWNTVPEN